MAILSMRTFKHVILTLAALSVVSCQRTTGNFSLVNKAPEPIAHASVKICEQSFKFSDVRPGKRVTGTYAVNSDSDYVIHVEFESGKQLEAQTGYVTAGVHFQHEISVNEIKIQITDTQIR